MFCVYVLQKGSSLYIGYTENLKRRLAEHSRNRNDVRILYFEAYLQQEAATRRERKLKQYGSAWRALKKRIDV